MDQPADSISDVFSEIYSNRTWGNGTSLSGEGSDPCVAAPYADYVLTFIEQQRCSSVVDIGHGDWRMWPPKSFQDVEYLGFDVANGLSTEVSERCGTSDRKFRHGDARKVELPDASLALCKDVLQHLSDADVTLVLHKLRKFPSIVISHDVQTKPVGAFQWLRYFKSSANLRNRWSLLRHGQSPLTRMSPRQNVDIPSGGYRILDLDAPPWGFRNLGFEIMETLDYPAGSNALPGVVKRIWLVRPC